MPQKKNEPPSESSLLSSATARLVDLLAAFRLFFVEMRQNITEHADWLLRRVEYLFIVYLWVSAGLFLMTLGLFFLAIDYGQVSRGIVFSVGGALIFLIAVIFLQTAKIKKYKR